MQRRLKMNDRLDLHAKLVDLLGSKQVYFQPPESVKIKYPCIIYERENIDAKHADDVKYLKTIRYEVMYISKDPDSNDLIKKILDSFKYCSYTRHFVSDNLNHEVFDLYY